MAVEFFHKDRLGKPLALGDFVAFPLRNDLEIGKIIAIHAKMLRVVSVDETGNSRYRSSEGSLKYPHDTVWLDPSKLTFYILRKSK